MTSNDGSSQLNDELLGLQDGPYVLRSLLEDVALSDNSTDRDVHITCVEYWNGNLYIGTSASEVRHYFSIPPEEGSEDAKPTFIPASRWPLNGRENGNGSGYVNGVQQILIMPSAAKACVLCNGHLSFHALPELSPIFTSYKPSSCTYVGGIDANVLDESDEDPTIMLCQRNRMRILTIGDERPTPTRLIEMTSCMNAVRRGAIACVADADTYSLLDVEQKQTIPLFPVSTNTDAIPDTPEKQPSRSGDRRLSSPALPSNSAKSLEPGHNRNKSMGTLSPNLEQLQEYSYASPSSTHQPSPLDVNGLPPRRSSLNPEAASLTPEGLGIDTTSIASTTSAQLEESTLVPPTINAQLRANIVSPTPNGFLMTVGSSYMEPSVGMLVNLDGDPVSQGALNFSTYPLALCVDGTGSETSSMQNSNPDSQAGYLLALLRVYDSQKFSMGLEVQRWDLDPSETKEGKHWLPIPTKEIYSEADINDSKQLLYASAGICRPSSSTEFLITECMQLLSKRRAVALTPIGADGEDRASERFRSESAFVRRHANISAQMLVWSKSQIWWCMRNPRVVRWESKLRQAVGKTTAWSGRLQDRSLAIAVYNEVRDEVSKDEFDFISLQYIRKKVSLLLYFDLARRIVLEEDVDDRERELVEQSLAQGEVDPRVLLAFLPEIFIEVVQNGEGIWLEAGLDDMLLHIQKSNRLREVSTEGEAGTYILQITKRYLMTWRRKKGFGSIPDGEDIFKSVDAGLLHILLLLDRRSTRGPATTGSIRQELGKLVDKGVDCFDRAVELLEEFKRLYVLSRLYQSRRQTANVLATWKRILEGEEDLGGEFGGEEDFRRFFKHISSAALVEEYGTWLARRNPQLGISLFADDESKVKFAPNDVVRILSEKAPDAVRYYLEHLVFRKNLPEFTNDLIKYYLDSVLSALSTTPSDRTALTNSYDTYRALPIPKPAYSHFAAGNPVNVPWWDNRLRLLQLLSGTRDGASNYDVDAIQSRIEPYANELIPEMIVLAARQHRHKDAIHLLTHGLGDFDTAVSYCVLGGAISYGSSTNLGAELRPSKDDQTALFTTLLSEFLAIADPAARSRHTSALLGRFAAWFDIESVLAAVPDDWSLDLLAEYLTSALRSLRVERNETAVTRALTSTLNLDANVLLVEKMDALGTVVDNGTVQTHVDSTRT